MSITTGTPETRTEHALVPAVIGFMISMGVPAVIGIRPMFGQEKKNAQISL